MVKMVSLLGNTLADYLMTDEVMINYLNQYCDTFEQKVNKNEFNLKIPLAVIQAFKRIYDVWDRNPTISKSLDCQFSEVYTMMASEFNKSNTTETECKCDHDEEIIVRDDDCTFINFVEENKQHLDDIQEVENLKWLKLLDGVDLDKSSSDGNQPCSMIKSMVTEIHYVMRCDLCNVNVSSFMVDENVVGQKNDDVRIRFGADALNHFWSTEHQQNLDTFVSNREFVDEYGKGAVSLYRCKLCDLIFGLPSLKEHYTDIEHLEKLYNFRRKKHERLHNFSAESSKNNVENGTNEVAYEDVTIMDIPDPIDISFEIISVSDVSDVH